MLRFANARPLSVAYALVLVGALLLLCAVPAGAATIAVDCNANPSALQPAINAAAPGDVLSIAGTCVGTFTVSKNLTLMGNAGAKLDAQGGGTTLTVSSGKVKVRGLTITGGTGTDICAPNECMYGGGIYNSGTLTLSTSTVNANTLTNTTTANDLGGGIYSDGKLTITSSTVSGNSNGSGNAFPPGYGGGIANLGGTLTIKSSTVSGNTASQRGGGILNTGTLTLSTSAVSGNSGPAGGGIWNENALTITRSTVSGNSAEHGGGIFNYGPDIAGQTSTITSTTVSGNTALCQGGGIENASEASLTITSSTVSGNTLACGSPPSLGGGIENEGVSLTIATSTVSGNTAEGGGGLSSGRGVVTLAASILAVNIGNPADCFVHDSGVMITSNGYNLIGDADGCSFAGATGDQVGSSSGSGVIDPKLGPLAKNGGKTKTMALLVGSPALDAIPVGTLGADGITPLCPASGTTDQRGKPRPSGTGCDDGAYERQV